MSDLTFETSSEHDGALRRWDLIGPEGVVRFEVAGGPSFVAPSVYLHAKLRDDFGDEPDDCSVCGFGWHDALLSRTARRLYVDSAAAGDEQVIRDQLEKWYGEFVAVPS